MSTTAMFTLAEARGWLGNAALQGEGSTAIARVHTDTRTLRAGDLFVALRGEKFDANDFLEQARSSGAAAAIAERGLAAAGLAGLEVADSRAALGELAAAWRARFDLPLIAVTGSNGKTTVTQMIASILRAWQGDAAFATEGNFNNDVGLPLTLLRLRATHKAGVVELGMNHPGEIAQLARIARPTVAMVNNAQREHQEFMATVEAVARENGAVLESLAADGTAVFPAGEEFTPVWRSLAAGRKCITFGDTADSSVRLVSAEWTAGAWHVRAETPEGEMNFSLGIAGRHNVRNALASAASALAAGVPLDAIARGLEAFSPVKGRSRAFTAQLNGAGGRVLTVVDDTYNANPDSVRAAIDVLAELPGPRLLVLGDMGEVGNEGPKFHAEVGAYANARGIEQLFTLGDAAQDIATAFGAARHFDSAEALCDAVIAALPASQSVLVKGSRFMKMERVIEAISTHAPQPKETAHVA